MVRIKVARGLDNGYVAEETLLLVLLILVLLAVSLAKVVAGGVVDMAIIEV